MHCFFHFLLAVSEEHLRETSHVVEVQVEFEKANFETGFSLSSRVETFIKG
jgi:hypothetical protein